MTYVMFENHSVEPPRFVELAWHDEPYFFASRREGEVGQWGEWDFYEDDDYEGWEVGQSWPKVVGRFREALGDEWNLVREHDEPRMEPRSAKLAARYGVALPQRVVRFFDTNEWRREYQGRTTVDPPMWSCTFSVEFDRLGLHMLADMFEMHDDDERKRYVPLTPLIGGDTQEYLAVDVTEERAPVVMWYHGSGKFYAYHDSLDAFLEALE